MGLYNVVKPCVVGKLHYARPTTEPIEVDDAAAWPLCKSGAIEPYPSGRKVEVLASEHPEGWTEDAQPSTSGPYALTDAETVRQAAEAFAEGVTEADPEPKPRPRGRRRNED